MAFIDSKGIRGTPKPKAISLTNGKIQAHYTGVHFQLYILGRVKPLWVRKSDMIRLARWILSKETQDGAEKDMAGKGKRT